MRTRGQANQSLYYARIVLGAWEEQRQKGALADEVLTGAFLPAVRLHLCESYGWFLLAVSGVENSDLTIPPGRVSDLDLPEAGKVRAPELHEFELLESTGWLADLLNGLTDSATAVASSNVLVSDHQQPGYAVALSWADRWSAIMARMDDSLAEC